MTQFNTLQIPGLLPVIYRPLTPIPEIAAEYLQQLRELGRSRRHYDTMRLLLARFGERFPGPIGGLLAADVRTFLLSLDAAPRTRNNWLSALRTLSRFAIRRRYLPKFWDELDLVDRFTVPPVAVGIYSPAEVRAILANCSAPFLPAVLLTVFAGVRSAEALRMSWSDIDVDRRLVTVAAAKAKTRARRLCPVSDNLRAWLASSAQDGLLYGGLAQSFHEGLARAVRRAGVDPRHNGLRHSFVSYRLALVQSVDQVALESGNSPAMIFRHYRELVTPAAAAEFWRIRPEDRQIELPLAA